MKKDRIAERPGLRIAQERVHELVRAQLLQFYREQKRDLPWRKTTDPYAIWVSEIMLQQTRVATVIPYFEKFMRAFPTVHALARAPLSRVLEHWSGLGYYRRARLLHAGAQKVARDHAGIFPRDIAQIRAIPGIGAYTAGAIGSIAFGMEEPAIDGNAERVLSRLFATYDISEIARTLVKGEDPGALVQAIMELGASLCAPREPSCDSCPLACRARDEGRVEEFPKPRVRAKKKRWTRVAIVAEKDGALLLARRKTDLVFGGLWEPPGADAPISRATDAARTLAKRLLAQGVSLDKRKIVRHVLTHRDLRVVVFVAKRARLLASPDLPTDYEEIAWTESAPMSTLAKKILAE